MLLIINDLSTNKFASQEEFENFVTSTFLYVYKCCKENKIEFLKSYLTYDKEFFVGQTLGEYINNSHNNNNPVTQLIKKMLIDLSYHEPYWEFDVYTKTNRVYKLPTFEKVPNCFSEAIERSLPLLTFAPLCSKEKYYSCVVDSKAVFIHNIMEVNDLVNYAFRSMDKCIEKFINHYRFLDCSVFEFYTEDEKCYAKDALYKNDLSVEDIGKFIGNLSRLYDDKSKGKDSRLWDKIETGKSGQNLYEYRLTISNSRELRMFFVMKKDKMIFLNGFIKKSEKTPKGQIKIAINLMKNIC